MEKGAKTAGSVVVTESTSGLPERKYFRIGEVAEIVGVEPHVLRYWETQFSQLRPHKARSGHRLYRRREVETLLVIKDLLHVQRFTIAGARQALRQGVSSTLPRAAEQLTLPPAPAVTARHTRVLESTIPQHADDADDADDAGEELVGDPDDAEELIEEQPGAGKGGDADDVDDLDDDDDVDDVDDADDEEELEFHLAGPLPSRGAETELVVEARDGDDLVDAMNEEWAGRRGHDVTAVELRTAPAATTTRRARRLLRQAARDLETLLQGLRRS
jgi:DNA-binding transcriptional MerR regulator